MLNIPLFLIRQHRFTIRCKELKPTENHRYYKLVLIRLLQYLNIANVNPARGISELLAVLWFLRIFEKSLNN